MCGIACVVDLGQRLELRGVIERMNTAVQHRGPDGSGIDVSGRVGLGHSRLSIIDLTDRSAQPMRCGDYSLSFNGEIYNYQDLRRDLESRGHRFITTSDTEVLLAALIEWGMGALHRLCGMFAFVFLDGSAGKLFLVRDRFGKKPLIYCRRPGFFCAASEAKQLLASGLHKPTVTHDVLLDFIVSGALNRSEETMLEGLTELRAGHYLCVDVSTGQFLTKRWYDLASQIKPSSDDYSTARDRVRALLQQSVVRRHRADVPIGACLSGGVDSSCIVAISKSLQKYEGMQTITSFAPHEGYDERVFSRSVAKSAGAYILELEPPEGDIWDPDRLEDINYFQDQPIPSGSHWNEFHVFKAAASLGLRVMLDGQGADEYFGGYGEFWMAAQLENARSGRLAAFLQGIAARAEATELSRRAVTINFFRSVLWRRGRPGLKIGPYPARWLRGEQAVEKAGASHNLSGDFRALSLDQIEVSSLPYQLHSEDRNSMRWSVEARLPFMDHELIEYVLGLPSPYKVGEGYQKRILRDAVPELPQLVARRKTKVGFTSPDAVALKGREASVREQVAEAIGLLSERIDGSVVLAVYDRMAAEGTWYDPLFFRLCSAAAWHRSTTGAATVTSKMAPTRTYV